MSEAEDERHEDEHRVLDAAHAEHRWPAATAVIVALVIYALLPSDVLSLAIRLPVIAIAAVAFVAVILANPVRMQRDVPWARAISVGLALLLASANLVALGRTVVLLVTSSPGDGPSVLIAALQVWVTNCIAFALVVWEIDRGGPVRRRHAERSELQPADLRFPQDEDHDAIAEVAEQSSERADWRPQFVDYLYESAVACMAFSPGSAMPLRPRMKLLLIVQSFAAFVLLALVIAHAVGQLGA